MPIPAPKPPRRAIHRLASLTAALAATALSACDPGYGIQGTVKHPDPSLAGHVLVVTVYPESKLGADGLPLTGEDESTPRLALAKRIGGDESPFRWGKLGCDAGVRVVAWVDLDDSAKLEEKLPAGRELDANSASEDLAAEAAAARPGPGDWRAVSKAMSFDQSVTCGPGVATIVLEPAPSK